MEERVCRGFTACMGLLIGVGILHESKSEVRKRILAARSSMSADEVRIKSEAIMERIIKSEAFAGARLVMCYMDFRNEVMTAGIISAALASGKRVALPRVCKCGNDRTLAVYEINDLYKDVEKGAWGIMEPCSHRLRRADENEIDLVIVPGVAFDVNRQRLGYGAGYYDSFLAKLRPGCSKIAVAFDLQVQECIPVEVHDVKMDAVITETGII